MVSESIHFDDEFPFGFWPILRGYLFFQASYYRFHPFSFCVAHVTLPETNITPEKWWFWGDDPFLFGARPYLLLKSNPGGNKNCSG